jgi:hypothetical protein
MADQPSLLRSDWAIENGLHSVRDVTFTEDASQPGSTETYSHPVMSSQVSAPLLTAGCRTKKMHGSSGVNTP